MKAYTSGTVFSHNQRAATGTAAVKGDLILHMKTILSGHRSKDCRN